MTVFTENPRAGEHLVREPFGPDRRIKGILKSGQNLLAGAVLGAVIAGAASVAVKASGANTGNGTFVIDATTPVLVRAKLGIYKLRCITAVTNGGIFMLEDPDGIVLSTNITIPAGAGNSVTVAEHIKGALTDASTDFIVGDGFDITVTSNTKKYVEHNPAGTDGSEVACGILFDAVNATSADKTCVVNETACIVNTNMLTWKSGMTTQQKTNALAQLAAQGITTVS